MKIRLVHIRTIIITAIIIIVISVGIGTQLKKKTAERKPSVIIAGLSEGQKNSFQQDLAAAFAQRKLIDNGRALLDKGNFEGAIKQFTVALERASGGGEKRIAILYLANTYEKKRNYKKALEYIRISIESGSDWSKPPVVERAKYLEYAIHGNYELAVEHAKKTIEEYKKIHRYDREIPASYVERLNDIIAAKEYILSLKKKE